MPIADAGKRVPIPVVPLRSDRLELVRDLMNVISRLLTLDDDRFRTGLEEFEQRISEYRRPR